MKVKFCFYILLLIFIPLKAAKIDSTKYLLPSLTFRPTIPQGDLNFRYPYFTTATLGMYYLNAKNWMFGLEGGVLFGGANLDSNHFNNMDRNSKLIDANGNPAQVRTQSRGYCGLATIGKIIPLSKKNNRNGLIFSVGFGFIEHRIKMQFDSYTVPQLEGDYLLGYDKLHNGLLSNLGIKYISVSKDGLSFMAGVDYGLAFTKNRRNWEFSQNFKDNKLKQEHLPSIHCTLFVPIKLNSKKQISYFE